MKTKIKQTLTTIFALFLVLCTLSACSKTPEKTILGKWYNDDGKCLDIRSDGSYKLEDSYGTGTWKYLDDNETIEFTDVYGDTNETKIDKDDIGDYIVFSTYGNFYRKTEDINENVKTSIKLTNAGNFSDGVAWIIYNDEKGVEELALINTEGKIIYQENNNSTFLPSEMDGVSYIKDKDGNYKLIAKDGNIVANSQDGEFDSILACGDGFALVYKYSGPKDSKHLYGVIDNKGKFVCDYIDLGFVAGYNYYKGCGVFSIVDNVGLTTLLNLYTGKTIYLSSKAPEFIDGIGYLPKGYYITNGKQNGNYFGMESYPAVSIDTNFDTTPINDFRYSTNGLLIAYDGGHGKPISVIDPKTNNKYALDYNSTQLIKLDYVDDFGLLKIKASDNNTYFTLLDKQAKEQFEAIKFDEVVKYANQKVIYKIGEKYTIIDTKGAVLADNLEYKTINEFSQDIALAITKYDEYCFINSKGEKILQNIHG